MTPSIVTTGWYRLDYSESPYEYTAMLSIEDLEWNLELRMIGCGPRSFYLQVPTGQRARIRDRGNRKSAIITQVCRAVLSLRLRTWSGPEASDRSFADETRQS